MKSPLILSLLLILGTHAAAQDTTEYQALLGKTRELVYEDSLNFSRLNGDTTRLDSITVKTYFAPILSSGSNKFKNKTYSLLGKITGNRNFDLLALLEEKRRSDSSGISVIYLVSLKKSGEYIANIQAAVNGTKKKSKSGYNISSTLLKGNKIILQSRITTREKSYEELTHYMILSGRFILDANN